MPFLVYCSLFSYTPDKEGESCAGNDPLLLGVLGGVMCLIIVSQSLVITFLFLRQKRASRLDGASPPLYTPNLITLYTLGKAAGRRLKHVLTRLMEWFQ